MKKGFWGALALLFCITAHAYSTGVGGSPVQKGIGATKGVGDLGAAMFGVRNDADATIGADNQYVPVAVDSTGKLKVSASVTEQATAADGAATPALGKMVEGKDNGGLARYLKVSTTGQLQVDVITEPATAANGSAGVPAALKAIAGYDGANLRALKTDSSGNAQVGVVAVPGRTRSANNTFSAVALTASGTQAGTAEDGTSYESIGVYVQGDQDFILDVYQGDDGSSWPIDQAQLVTSPSGAGITINVRLTAKYFMVGISNFGGSPGNFEVTTYLSHASDSFPSSAIDLSTMISSYYSRIRAQLDQLPASLGQTNKAGSVSVAIANDQVGTAGSAAANVLSVQGIASMTPVKVDGGNTNAVKVDGSAVTQPVSGTVTASRPTVASATLSNWSNSASSGTAAASNASRKGLMLVNDSTTDCYYKFGATASTTSYSVHLYAGDTFIMDPPIYTGIVDAICASGTGTTRVTEL